MDFFILSQRQANERLTRERDYGSRLIIKIRNLIFELKSPTQLLDFREN